MSEKPKIAVVAVGSAATQVMIDLIPEMPKAKFLSFMGLDQSMKLNSLTTSDTTKFKNTFRKLLKYRLYPSSNVMPVKLTMAKPFLGIKCWQGTRIKKDDEIWYWEDCHALTGGGGLALVRDGNVIHVRVTFIS